MLQKHILLLAVIVVLLVSACSPAPAQAPTEFANRSSHAAGRGDVHTGANCRDCSNPHNRSRG